MNVVTQVVVYVVATFVFPLVVHRYPWSCYGDPYGLDYFVFYYDDLYDDVLRPRYRSLILLKRDSFVSWIHPRWHGFCDDGCFDDVHDGFDDVHSYPDDASFYHRYLHV